MKQKILLIEDDLDIRDSLRYFLEKEGHEVHTVHNGQIALDLIVKGMTHYDQAAPSQFDVILSDVRMPVMDGRTFVQKLKEIDNETPVILMTAFGTIQTAVDAIKSGAHDFLTKPINFDDLRETLRKTFEYTEIITTKMPEEKNATSLRNPNLIGDSHAMERIWRLVDRVARVDSTVLVLGESGVGKEVIAKEIHSKSPRKLKNFIAINCAAIPSELLESELFGHSKGSFTGATVQKRGLFEEADGGTLFLDEIGDMPHPLQAKLLRVIQDRQIRAVGSNVVKDLDVRIIAATHKDLRLAIAEGSFREDLYYRLSVIPMFIPPLRERPEDIRPLAIHFAKRASIAINEGYKTFSEDALQKLQSYSWKGNIRELENAIERSLVMCPRHVIKSEDLGFLDVVQSKSSLTPHLSTEGSLCLKDVERETVILALKKAEGKKAKAARLLGIDRKTLHRKEREYQLNNT